MNTARIILFIVGYPAAIVVIARFVPVVRERRMPWIVVHHLGVIAIIIGWSLVRNWGAVTVNGLWLVASTVWYARRGRVGRAGP